MAKHHFYHRGNESPIVQTNRYLFGRIKRLYPPYVFSLLVIAVIYTIENNGGIHWFLNHIYETKWQYLFIHFLFPNIPFDMRAIWYMSSFVFVSYALYFFLAYNEKLSIGIIPIVSIIVFGHIFGTHGTICMQGAWDGWFMGGTLRAFAEMGLGAYLFYNISVRNNVVTKTRKLVVTIIRCGTLLLIIKLMRLYAIDMHDFEKIALFVIYIYVSNLEGYGIKIGAIRKVISWCGEIEYWIFLIHLIISHLMVLFVHQLEYRTALVVYLILITVLASLLRVGEKYVRKRIQVIA